MSDDPGIHGTLGAAALQLSGQGHKSLVVTSSRPGEGKTRIVAEMARGAAADQAASVLVIDADPFHPAQHERFGVPRGRGLHELLEEVYGLDLSREEPDQFGLGDFLEILRAQRRTGELTVEGEGQKNAIDLVQGSIQSIATAEPGLERRLGEILFQRGRITERDRDEALRIHLESGRRLGDVLTSLGRITPEQLGEALHEQASERLAQLLALRQPHCRFLERAESYLPASGGRATAADTSALDAFLFDRLHDYLGQPFLASQVPSYFTDTPARNLKLLTAGGGVGYRAARHGAALRLLVGRLRRIFDLVLIDAPAVERSNEAVTLGGLADGVLLVARTDTAGAQDVRRVTEKLRRGGANVLGLVLNHPGGSFRDSSARSMEVGRGTASPY